jgi:hypothetical protein
MSLGRALHTVEDYERAARAATPAVRAVTVRAAANDPKMKAGVVELRPRGRGIGPFRRRLSKRDEQRVRAAVAERNPIGVELRLK